MKSSYELAMERLAAKEPATRPLTDAQRRALADLDTRYKAKLAEREIFLQGELDRAMAGRKTEEVAQIQVQLKRERARLEEEREEAKERVRRGE